jgi:hypothetical protein
VFAVALVMRMLPRGVFGDFDDGSDDGSRPVDGRSSWFFFVALAGT